MKEKKMMELNKSILLLLISSSLISAFANGQDASPAPSPAVISLISKATSPRQSPSSTASAPSPSQSSSLFASSDSKSVPAESPLPPATSARTNAPAGAAEDSHEGLPLLFPNPSSSGNPVLKKICDSTDHPTECLTSITPFQTGESDPVSVLKMEMQALRQGFKKAIAKATEINDDPAVAIEVKGCLDTCLEIYDSGLYDLDDALEAINSHDIDRLKTVLSAAVSDIETCEEAFEEEGTGDSPMKEFDKELTTLASNNLAIASALLR
ncbi:putative pectinesterase/pectinesterase inhibitor 26 [Hevea brasiliensis]|nr:putative pectinesterase/pectinesterase inhibitor 26 [Hevea brasiliensis]